MTVVPSRSQASSAMVQSMRQVLRHAEQIAVTDLRDDERIQRLQERVVAAELERSQAVAECGRAETARSQAEGERDTARRERDEALTEVAELRSRKQSSGPDVAITETSRAAMVGLLETAITGRAAEALRRRSTEKLLIGVAASDQAFRRTTYQSRTSCRCHETTLVTLAAAAPLPTTANSRILKTTVDRVLKSLDVGQPVNLDSHQVGEYGFDDDEDRVGS